MVTAIGVDTTVNRPFMVLESREGVSAGKLMSSYQTPEDDGYHVQAIPRSDFLVLSSTGEGDG